MKGFKLLGVIFLSVMFLSCGEDQPLEFSYNFKNDSNKFTLAEPISFQLQAPDIEIDSVSLVFQQENYKFNSAKISIPTKKLLLGKHRISGKAFTGKKAYDFETKIHLLNKQKPKVYSFEIVAEYPHDIRAYTQGLEFYNDTLYESTGQWRRSSLRKVDYKSGKILKSHNLPDRIFAEGLSILNDKIYQLSWKAGKGFIYDLETFDQLGEFEFDKSKEGWGLCNDGEVFYKSDGTEKIWILDPEEMKELNYIQPTTHKGSTTRLNELEWINGKIYANTYLKDGIAIINPKNGAVEGIIDFRGLRDKVKEHKDLDVLNGIAYLKNEDKIFVTGKNWDKLFEVKVVEK
ncbi:MAG: glutaminyl-peptide cyclotransferase [Bacteroidota bacterium]